MEKVQRQTAGLRTAGPDLTRGIHVGSNLRKDRCAGCCRRQWLPVEGCPGIEFRGSNRLIHSAYRFGGDLRGERPKAIWGVSGVEIAEVRMVERVDEVDAEIDPAFSFGARKRQREILRQ